jgi:hypothetical protein
MKYAETKKRRELRDYREKQRIKRDKKLAPKKKT